MLPIHKARQSVFNYDEIPAGYYFGVMESGPAVQRYWHRRKFQGVADCIEDGTVVLDLGCGPGSFLSVFAETHPSSVGVGADIASRQISFAESTVAPRFGERVRFVAIDEVTGRVPVPDASVDVVTCIEVLEHIHPFWAIQLLTEARRVLKPGGKLIATTPNYRSFWPAIEWLLERRSQVKYHEQHINKFTPNSFVKFIETAGFDVLASRSMMIFAPFLAGLSKNLADLVDRLETKVAPSLGSLLLVEARPLVVSVPQAKPAQSTAPHRPARDLPPLTLT